MNAETLMTDAATTTDSAPASQPAADPATVAADVVTQPAGQATDAAPAGEAKADDKPQGAPESYEFNPPEGREFDADVLGVFSEAAKEANLSQESAQKVLDKIAPALAAKQERMMEAARAEWVESAKADKEFGGDKLAENVAVAKKALEAFGTPELTALLNESGLGNHPEIIRAFYRAGKAISEDGFVAGRGSGAAPADPAKVLFPNQA